MHFLKILKNITNIFHHDKLFLHKLPMNSPRNFHAHGVLHCKDQSLVMWATTRTINVTKLAFKLIVRETHCPVNEL